MSINNETRSRAFGILGLAVFLIVVGGGMYLSFRYTQTIPQPQVLELSIGKIKSVEKNTKGYLSVGTDTGWVVYPYSSIPLQTGSEAKLVVTKYYSGGQDEKLCSQDLCALIRSRGAFE